MTDELKVPPPPPPDDDPDLDAFTRLMETGSSLDDTDEIRAREVDLDMVEKIEGMIGAFLETDVRELQPYYLEVQMALGAIFLNLARAWLLDCDYETFTLNRAAMLRVIGVMSTHINEIPPDPELLEGVIVSEIRH